MCVHKSLYWLGIGLAFLLGVSCSPDVFAGPLADTGLAFNDGSGPTGGIWRDSQSGTGSIPFPPPGATLSAFIDYAVFAPGVFDDFLAAEGAVGTANPPGYVYAYQYTVTASTGGGAAVGTTVGLHTEALVFGPFSVQLNGSDVSPTGGTLNPGSSVRWDLPSMTSGSSAILYFHSPDGPQFDNVTVLGSPGPVGPSFPGLGFSPVQHTPEPTSLCFVALAGVGVGLFGRRRIGCRREFS